MVTYPDLPLPTTLTSGGHRSAAGRILVVVVATLLVSSVLMPTASARRFVAGVYGRDSSKSGVRIIRRTGFNAVTISVNTGNIRSSLDQMDRLHRRGMRVVVWLGSYAQTVPCGFEQGDDQVTEVVRALRDHPAIAAYQVGDEVDQARAFGCDGVPEDIAARSAVIRAADPHAKTYATLTAFDGTEWYPYQDFVGTVSILGLVIYPCDDALKECNWRSIDKAIRQAESDGVDRYWAVIQDHGSATYRQPTPRELRKQFRRWRHSRLRGYFVYHWVIGGIENRPGHLRVLRRQNAYYRSR